MYLSPFNSALIATLASAAMAAALYATAARQPEELARPRRIWARAILLAPIGWLLIEWARDIPSLAVPGKTLVIASFVEYLRALMASRGRLPDSPWFAVPVAFVAVASAIMLFTQPDQPMRVGVLSVLCGGLAASTAIFAYRLRRPGHGGNALVVAVAFMTCAVVLLGRGALLLVDESRGLREWAQAPWFDALRLGASVLAPAIASLGFVLMGSERLLERLEGIANTDALTGLSNRDAFLRQAAAALLSASGHPSALLIVDLDHFRRINDRHGRDIGDRALRLVAEALRDRQRSGDLIGRLGGEEFAMLLPRTAPAAAESIASQLHAAATQIALLADGQSIPLRVSIGLATTAPGDDDLGALVRRADQALYAAKNGGRDQIRVHPAGPA